MKCCIISENRNLIDQIKHYLSDVASSFNSITLTDYSLSKLNHSGYELYLVDVCNDFIESNQVFADDDSIVFYIERYFDVGSIREAQFYYNVLKEQIINHPNYQGEKVNHCLIQQCPVVIFFGSTGGIESLLNIISSIESASRLSVIVAQHIGVDGIPSLVSLLKERIPNWEVFLSSDQPKLIPGRLVVCHPGYTMEIVRDGFLSATIDENSDRGVRPCFDNILKGFIQLDSNTTLHTVFLSGIGNNGVEGLKSHGLANRLDIIVESESTRAVSVLPESIKKVASQAKILSSHEISQYIIRLSGETA